MNLDDPFVDGDEYQAKYANRLYGMYASVVKDIEDPQRLGRVRVKCPNVFGDDLSPWCLACFPSALGVDSGSVMIPPLHSYVWITFEEGDPRSPIYMGGFAVQTARGRDSDGSGLEDSNEHQDNQSPLPTHAQGLPDGTDTEGSVRDYRNIPPSSYRGEYGKVQMTRTELGNVIELNDSVGATRLFISHGPSGAFYEIRHDGTIVESTTGFKRSLNSGEHSVVEGNMIKEVDGSLTGVFAGAVDLNFGNNLSIDLGADTLRISPGFALETTSFVVASKGEASITANSALALVGGDSVAISSGGARIDTAVGGIEITALNSLDPTTLGDSLRLTGSNGLTSLQSTDPSGLVAFGFEATATIGDVVLGNLTLPSESRRSPTSVPLIKEGVVMGTQLQIALTALVTALSTYTKVLSSGGSTPGFGAPNPVLAAANIALTTALDSWAGVYGVPGPKGSPIYASDSVFVSK